MNYRHAFHAGNFADCMKHALLVWLVRALQRKDTPIAVLDTHAGIGMYDLESSHAARTGEWKRGIARLTENPPEVLEDYVAIATAKPSQYPGSPEIVRTLLRPQDRLVCSELHPEDFGTLKRRYARDRQITVYMRDAWKAMTALLPFPERRGLILIDPPFEEPDEFEQLQRALCAGHKRFATGVFAAWYPIKHRTPVRMFHEAMQASGIHDIVAAELWLRTPIDPTKLNGCGLLVINPPYGFEEAASNLLAALSPRLGEGDYGEGHALIRLVEER